jgi:hypothetical protein
MQSIPFWHSAFPLHTWTWPWFMVPCVGQLAVHDVDAMLRAMLAMPQQTCPDGQSLSPSQLKAAVRMGHFVPWFTHLPVGLLLTSSPTQQVWVRRSQDGVDPHGATVGAEASSGSGGGLPASNGLPASALVPELEPEPEPDPELELGFVPELEPDPEVELELELDPDAEPDVDPLPLAVPPPPLEDDESSPKPGSLALLAQAAATNANPPTTRIDRSDREAFNRT